MKFKLGESLKDKVTGFEGVVMGITLYYTDCTHYGLCSRTLKDGQPTRWEWFDETRLEIVEGSERLVLNEREKPTSGPHPNAPGV